MFQRVPTIVRLCNISMRTAEQSIKRHRDSLLAYFSKIKVIVIIVVMKPHPVTCLILTIVLIGCASATTKLPSDLLVTSYECVLMEGLIVDGRCIFDNTILSETKPDASANQVHPSDAVIVPNTVYNNNSDNGFEPLTEAENYHVQLVCGKAEEPRKRINNGKIASPKQFPWIINLGVCTGILISPRHVLTAQHCLTSESTDYCPSRDNLINSTIDYGGVCRGPETGCPHGSDMKKATISRVIYPRENPMDCTPKNDIAVVLLTENIKFDKFVNPICISKLDPKDLVQLRDVGFGHIKEGVRTNLLRYMDTIITKYDWPEVVTKGIDQGDKTASVCSGDSGGPLQATFKGSERTYLAGIHSRGVVCDIHGWMVSTYVPAFADWICQLTGVCEII